MAINTPLSLIWEEKILHPHLRVQLLASVLLSGQISWEAWWGLCQECDQEIYLDGCEGTDHQEEELDKLAEQAGAGLCCWGLRSKLVLNCGLDGGQMGPLLSLLYLMGWLEGPGRWFSEEELSLPALKGAGLPLFCGPGGAVRISQELWSGDHWGRDCKRPLDRVEERDYQEGELDRLEKKWASRECSPQRNWGCTWSSVPDPACTQLLWLRCPYQWMTVGGCRDPTGSNPREEDFLQHWRAQLLAPLWLRRNHYH
jgi:hypothetical protein